MLNLVETRMEGVARGAGSSKRVGKLSTRSVAQSRAEGGGEGEGSRKGSEKGVKLKWEALTLARRTAIRILIAQGG